MFGLSAKREGKHSNHYLFVITLLFLSTDSFLIVKETEREYVEAALESVEALVCTTFLILSHI